MLYLEIKTSRITLKSVLTHLRARLNQSVAIFGDYLTPVADCISILALELLSSKISPG